MILDVTFKSYLHLLSWLWWPIGRVLRLWRWECVRLLWVSSWCLWSGHKLCAVEISLEGLVEPISKNIFHAAGCKEDFWVSFSDSAGARTEGANCNARCYISTFWAITYNLEQVEIGGPCVTCCCMGTFWVITVVWGPKEWTVPLVGDEICIEEIELVIEWKWKKLSHPMIVMVILTSCLFTSWARAMTTT